MLVGKNKWQNVNRRPNHVHIFMNLNFSGNYISAPPPHPSFLFLKSFLPCVYGNRCYFDCSYQSSGTSKSRLSKRNFTIPRLELMAMHMEANLCKNIEDSLEEQPQSESFMDGLTVQLLYIGQEGEEPINNLRATGLIK